MSDLVGNPEDGFSCVMAHLNELFLSKTKKVQAKESEYCPCTHL